MSDMSPPPPSDQTGDHDLPEISNLLLGGARVFYYLSPPTNSSLSPDQYTHVTILVTCGGSPSEILAALSKTVENLRKDFNPDWTSHGLFNLTTNTDFNFAKEHCNIELPEGMRPGNKETMYVIRGDFHNPPTSFQEVLTKELSEGR